MRIKFQEDKIRALFFDKIKQKYSISWKEIYKQLNVQKTTFERYKAGTFMIPEELFDRLSSILDKDSKELILRDIKKFSNNYGQIKGGKISFAMNKEYFNEGRKKGLASIKRNRKKDNISFKNLILTPELCELIGAFIGDGMFNVYNNKLYEVAFAGDRRYDIDYYQKIIIPAAKQVQSNINPRIYDYHKRENAVRIVFYSKTLFLFLRDFCHFAPGKKAHTVSIPGFLFENEATRNKIIRGIFDTDGGVFLDKREAYKKLYPRIIFQTVSKPLFEQLNLVLSEQFRIYKRFNEKRRVYIIEIYGINQVRNWMKIIGFSNSRHLNKINLLQ